MPVSPPLGIAIAGLGTVGSGVARIITDHQAFEDRLFLKSILERAPEQGPAQEWYKRHPGWFTQDIEKILTDPEISIIIETIGGDGFARDLTFEALKHGKHVVTANKDLIATHGAELCAEAQRLQLHYLFEASVAGAIPVLRLLREYFQTQDLTQLEGILNGTTNYILSQMESSGQTFSETLTQAQKLGFAEQDPSNDIKGYDTRYKLVILTYLITGQWFPPATFQLEGIDHLELPDFDHASRMGLRIKLIAYLCIQENQFQAYVLPMMLQKDTVLAKISGSTNVVSLKGRYSQEITLSGKGAGSLPTASAIVADLNRIARNPSPIAWPVSSKTLKLIPFGEQMFRHTLRFEVLDEPGVVGHIGNILAKRGINIYALEQLPQYHRIRNSNRDTVIFTITLEPCKEGKLREAAQEINLAPFMLKPVNVLRESV